MIHVQFSEQELALLEADLFRGPGSSDRAEQPRVRAAEHCLRNHPLASVAPPARAPSRLLICGKRNLRWARRRPRRCTARNAPGTRCRFSPTPSCPTWRCPSRCRLEPLRRTNSRNRTTARVSRVVTPAPASVRDWAAARRRIACAPDHVGRRASMQRCDTSSAAVFGGCAAGRTARMAAASAARRDCDAQPGRDGRRHVGLRPHADAGCIDGAAGAACCRSAPQCRPSLCGDAAKRAAARQ
jgi:hypothetical protein